MPRQNRVTPFGEIIATPERGLFMGNRGVLHNARQEIVRPYKLKAWIICLLEFKERHRQIMQPGRYTELFFLDEATALAAGHRPCFECQRERAVAFRGAWAAGNRVPGPIKVADMDNVLHQERLTKAWRILERRKKTFTAVLNTLPDGTFVVIQDRPALIWQQKLYAWSPGGYQILNGLVGETAVVVLTPPSTVNALAQGYQPIVHRSIIP